jgi:rRNA-processing protein FCF1
VYLVEVLCDTNFLIHLATKRIKNISNLETDIGQIEFVVPEVVINELKKLSKKDEKKQEALVALDFCNKLNKIPLLGKFADEVLIKHVKKYGGIIGTMDRELKQKVKNAGGSIMSCSNDRIVLES